MYMSIILTNRVPQNPEIRQLLGSLVLREGLEYDWRRPTKGTQRAKRQINAHRHRKHHCFHGYCEPIGGVSPGRHSQQPARLYY